MLYVIKLHLEKKAKELYFIRNWVVTVQLFESSLFNLKHSLSLYSFFNTLSPTYLTLFTMYTTYFDDTFLLNKNK